MFTRIVEIRTKMGKAKDFNATLNDKVLPILQKQPGFMDEITLISTTEPDRILALSFWKSEADAERYNQQQFPKIKEMLNPLLDTVPKVETFNADTSTPHKIFKAA